MIVLPCHNSEWLACRLRLLERGINIEPELPDASVTVKLVSTIVKALVCDERSPDSDFHDDSRWWADCELAGDLCNLFQVRLLFSRF